MFYFRETKYKCPYCKHEYKEEVTSASTCTYKGKRYERPICENCHKEFLYSEEDNICIERPVDDSELSNFGAWMT